MNCFIMKTLTVDDDWYEFSMTDIPTLQSEEQFILMNKFPSPILRFDSIVRGDVETGLFEGDVIFYEGREWLVCYERGFYVINSDYVVRYLYYLDKYKLIGRYDEFKDLPPIAFRRRYLFKYKNQIFRFNDIAGAYEGKMLLRFAKEPVNAKYIQQACGLRYNNLKICLGDIVNNSRVKLVGGRITIRSKSGELIDISTGGVLDGYIPRGTRRG